MAGRRNIVEKKMFGGVAFLHCGNMLVGVWQDLLIARLGAEEGAKALAEPFVREFDLTGRPTKSWVIVEPDGLDADLQLSGWIERALAFVSSLPAKI